MLTPATEKTVHRICPLCEACCGLELKVSDNQVISIRGHEDISQQQYRYKAVQ